MLNVVEGPGGTCCFRLYGMFVMFWRRPTSIQSEVCPCASFREATLFAQVLYNDGHARYIWQRWEDGVSCLHRCSSSNLHVSPFFDMI